MQRVFAVFILLLLVFTYAAPALAVATPIPSPEFDLCGTRIGATPIDQEEHDKCMECLFNSSGVRQETQYTVIGCLPTSAGGLTQALSQFSSAVIGGISFLVFMYGGYQLLTSAGNPTKLSSGKKLMTSALITMLVVLFATFIFRFAAQDLIKIPGIE